MAPVAKRFTIASTGSTSSSGTGGRTAVVAGAQPQQAAKRRQLLGLVVDEAAVLA